MKKYFLLSALAALPLWGAEIPGVPRDSNTNITGRNVYIRTDMSVKFCHKCLTESHNFSIALASGIKVRTTFTTANRQTG